MLRSYLFLISFLHLAVITFAQSNLDSLMFAHWNNYYSGGSYLIVQGSLSGNYPGLNEIFDSWRKDNPDLIKHETELDSSDLCKHLQFYGPIKSFTTLKNYTPEVLIITDESFIFGDDEYNQPFDAIRLISHLDNRMFLLSNSFEGLKSLWTTFQELSQYFIMQNYSITSHGFLDGNKFCKAEHYNTDSLRNLQLKLKSTEYYNFYYSPDAFSASGNIDSLFRLEDAKLKKCITFLNLPAPERKINCFLYKDLEQKYYLSATPGFGNPFPKAYQNHSIGLSPVEHESIHILLDNLIGPASTFYSEGLVGYYFSSIDSNEWKKTRQIVSSKLSFPVKKYLENSSFFSFSPLDYAGSAFHTKFLIETYGISSFYNFIKYGDNAASYNAVYGKNIDSIVNEWNSYFESHKTIIGVNKTITFKITAPGLPESENLFITGDNSQLADWNPGLVKLTKTKNDTWEISMDFPKGTIISYKITRGAWDNEALNSDGNIPGNSLFEVNERETINLSIKRWKDGITGN